jgi:hypothetical protein
MTTIHPGDADPDEVAAALVAVALLLEAEQTPDERPAMPWQWRASAALLGQRMTGARPAVRPHWGSVERMRRYG